MTTITMVVVMVMVKNTEDHKEDSEKEGINVKSTNKETKASPFPNFRRIAALFSFFFFILIFAR